MALTGGQIRMARGYLRWSVSDLAERAKVGVSTVKRAEAVDGPPPINQPNLDAMRRVLEAAGIEFILENGGGEGVRLRKGDFPKSERVDRSVRPESEVRGGPEASERPEIETDE
jgi:hypothetical protein